METGPAANGATTLGASTTETGRIPSRLDLGRERNGGFPLPGLH